MREIYTEHILDNGLTVLLQENHSTPIASHCIWYRVGSRNEVPGKTGISHWVEHMQFRGTERYPEQEAVKKILREGGDINAYTGKDGTAFYEIMPVDKINIALDIEADRMENSVFDPDMVDLERTVIISELELGNSQETPSCKLAESVRKVVFPHHPYSRDTIGDIGDLKKLTREDLYEYYRTWYTPNNAIVSVVGDFDTDEMLQSIETAYGNIPAHPIPTVKIISEKPIQERQLVEEHGHGEYSILQIAWLLPIAKDPDFMAVSMLNSILAGPDPMDPFGSSNSFNRTTRLFQKMITKGLADNIYSTCEPCIDPDIFSFSTTLNKNVTAEDAENTIMFELENIALHGVKSQEIERARRQIRSVIASVNEDVMKQAHWLGLSAIFADPTWYMEFLRRIEQVTSDDISRVAGTLFRRDNCVIGVYSKEE